MATRAAELVDRGTAKDGIKGCVFYHRQDADELDDHGFVHLAYGPLETEKHGTVGFPAVEIGQLVTRILGEVGLAFEWDGSPDTRILVSCR